MPRSPADGRPASTPCARKRPTVPSSPPRAATTVELGDGAGDGDGDGVGDGDGSGSGDGDGDGSGSGDGDGDGSGSGDGDGGGVGVGEPERVCRAKKSQIMRLAG